LLLYRGCCSCCCIEVVALVVVSGLLLLLLYQGCCSCCCIRARVDSCRKARKTKSGFSPCARSAIRASEYGRSHGLQAVELHPSPQKGFSPGISELTDREPIARPTPAPEAQQKIAQRLNAETLSPKRICGCLFCPQIEHELLGQRKVVSIGRFRLVPAERHPRAGGAAVHSPAFERWDFVPQNHGSPGGTVLSVTSNRADHSGWNSAVPALCPVLCNSGPRQESRPSCTLYAVPCTLLFSPFRLIFISCQEAHLFTKVTFPDNTRLTSQKLER
jgi:hypothetical protein